MSILHDTLECMARADVRRQKCRYCRLGLPYVPVHRVMSRFVSQFSRFDRAFFNQHDTVLYRESGHNDSALNISILNYPFSRRNEAFSRGKK